MTEIVSTTGTLASFIGSLTVVGGALIWIYNKFIGEPREVKRMMEEEKRQQRMVSVITRENKPLNESIQQLTEWLNESKADRENLNKIATQNTATLIGHEKELDDHNNRLIVLEVKNNIPPYDKGGV